MPTQQRLRELFYYKDGILYHNRQSYFARPVGSLHRDKKHLSTTVEGSKQLVHRIIWTLHYGAIPEGMLIDHIDHNGFNNRIENLRLATKKTNGRNAGRSKANTSGHTGVVWFARHAAWNARLSVDGEHLHLGYYVNLDTAALVRRTIAALYGFHPNHGL